MRFCPCVYQHKFCNSLTHDWWRNNQRPDFFYWCARPWSLSQAVVSETMLNKMCCIASCRDCLEMLRKVTITGLIVFVSQGSMLQVVVALLLSIGFGFTAAWVRVHKHEPPTVLWSAAP